MISRSHLIEPPSPGIVACFDCDWYGLLDQFERHSCPRCGEECCPDHECSEQDSEHT